jgi:hypothetical protein
MQRMSLTGPFAQTIEITRGTTKLTAGYTSAIGQVSVARQYALNTELNLYCVSDHSHCDDSARGALFRSLRTQDVVRIRHGG